MSKYFLLFCGIVLLFPVPAVADGPQPALENPWMKAYRVEGAYEEVLDFVKLGIADRGMKINNVSHIGKMLQRTAEAVGANKTVYAQAKALEFCSAVVSRAMMEANPHFIVSDTEMRRDGPSYTIDTIKEMRSAFPRDTDLFFILGLDNLFEIELWKNPHEIIKECKLLVARRVYDECGEIPAWLQTNVKMIDVPLIGISSSDIRRRIKNGQNICYLVPDAVVEIITRNS